MENTLGLLAFVLLIVGQVAAVVAVHHTHKSESDKAANPCIALADVSDSALAPANAPRFQPT